MKKVKVVSDGLLAFTLKEEVEMYSKEELYGTVTASEYEIMTIMEEEAALPQDEIIGWTKDNEIGTPDSQYTQVYIGEVEVIENGE